MLFSILIPAYKAKYFRECLQSIINQTFKDFEVIILNDSSPEDIESIVKEFADNRIQYYLNERNVGAKDIVNNWNKCLFLSHGEYVICMGDDDMLMDNCLEVYKEAVDNNPDIEVFHCRSYIIDETSKKTSLTTSWPESESIYDNIWHRINNYREQFIGDFLYKSKDLKEKGGFYYLPFAWSSDDITSYRAMDERGVVHINEPIFCYRKNRLTITSSGDPNIKLQAISLEQKWFKSFMSIHTPKQEKDMVTYSDIERTLPIYFKRKRIYTVAYCSKTQKHLLRSFIFWMTHRKNAQLSISEMVYTFFLAFKNKLNRGRI